MSSSFSEHINRLQKAIAHQDLEGIEAAIVGLWCERSSVTITQDQLNDTLLYACKTGNPEIIGSYILWLQYWGLPLDPDHEESRCLEYMLEEANPLEMRIACITTLIGCGANPNPQGWSPIMQVAEDNPHLISLMVNLGSDINAQDDEGRTPLIFAIEEGCDWAAKRLLELGAEPNIGLNNGDDPLRLAIWHSRYDGDGGIGVLDLLRSKGAVEIDGKTQAEIGDEIIYGGIPCVKSINFNRQADALDAEADALEIQAQALRDRE
jgi:hypothetical protein